MENDDTLSPREQIEQIALRRIAGARWRTMPRERRSAALWIYRSVKYGLAETIGYALP
jgi:hypothetical protein